MSAEFNRFNSLKILTHADRLRKIADGQLPYPIDWHIYPSNYCNHKCTWCMFRQNGEQENYKVFLPEEILLRAVRDAAQHEARLIHFSGGGEPLLNKSTVKAMQLAKSLKMAVALSTNGRLLTPEVASTTDYIRVSLNAGTAEQHWKTNHAGDSGDKGDWEQIMANIKTAVPHKLKDMGLGFVVDYENWKDIYPFCQMAAESGVDFVHIRPAFYYDKEKDRSTRDIMPEAFNECARAKSDFGKSVKIFAITEKFDGYWTPRSYTRCHAVKTGITLRATGNFSVCQDRTDLTFGNNPSYANGASFESVWYGKEHLDIMESIKSGGELDSCPRCVWNKRNEIIEAVFINDEMRLDMI